MPEEERVEKEFLEAIRRARDYGNPPRHPFYLLAAMLQKETW